MQCCFPKVYGGCDVEPGKFFPPGVRVPTNFQAPSGYLPSPGFLRAVCCPAQTECCPVDQASLFPTYQCCASDKQSCSVNDKKGVCYDLPSNNTGTTIGADSLDGAGRCPDGSLPLTIAPNTPFQCTLNKFLPSTTTQGGCPASSTCIKDRSGNVNSGVCCRDSACGNITSCTECASNKNNVTGGCSWLTQGDLYTPSGKCVSNCANFPGQSCIIGGRTEATAASLCPRTAANVNGTNFNTGSCGNRRCGMVGTGRSSRINNGTAPTNATFTNALPCCDAFPGDYCCNYMRELSSNCAFGRIPQGPMCGVPVRGSPSTFYNTRPQQPYYGGYPGMYPPMPYQPYMPNMMPWGYRQGGFYGGPSVYGGVYPQMSLYNLPPSPIMYNSFRPQVYYAPPPMMYMPPPMYMAPPRPPYVANPIDQKPSPYICSCDFKCVEYMDCCDDFKSFCCSNTSNATACH